MLMASTCVVYFEPLIDWLVLIWHLVMAEFVLIVKRSKNLKRFIDLSTVKFVWLAKKCLISKTMKTFCQNVILNIALA